MANRPRTDNEGGRRPGRQDPPRKPRSGEPRSDGLDERDDEGMEGIDFTAEGSDSGVEKNPDRTDRGYDVAAHSGPAEYGVPSGAGGVFGTTGGGSYAGGFQVIERPGLYDRSGAPGPFEPGRGRSAEYGRNADRFDSVDFRGRESHRGRGPRGYRVPDQRIEEEVVHRLTDDHAVDATNVEVTVKEGEVTLSGRVASREMRRIADRIAEETAGVRQVFNNLRVEER